VPPPPEIAPLLATTATIAMGPPLESMEPRRVQISVDGGAGPAFGLTNLLHQGVISLVVQRPALPGRLKGTYAVATFDLQFETAFTFMMFGVGVEQRFALPRPRWLRFIPARVLERVTASARLTAGYGVAVNGNGADNFGFVMPTLSLRYALRPRTHVALDLVSLPMEFSKDHFLLSYRVMAYAGYDF
jgi:hypothetical protein